MVRFFFVQSPEVTGWEHPPGRRDKTESSSWEVGWGRTSFPGTHDLVLRRRGSEIPRAKDPRSGREKEKKGEMEREKDSGKERERERVGRQKWEWDGERDDDRERRRQR